MSFAKPRIQPYIVPVAVYELTEKDMVNLDKALKEDYDGSKVDEILEKAATGFSQIWRLGKSEGIIVSEIIQRDDGLHLWVPQIGGRKILEKLDLLEDFFAKYGQEHGCVKFRCAVMRKGLQKVYSKRWKEIARIYERNLS